MSEKSKKHFHAVSSGMEAFHLEQVKFRIYNLRGVQVMIDRDLAELYGVEAKVLNQAVKRNSERFPGDFMFQLLSEEYKFLRSQLVTLETGRGKFTKYLPYVFTENGIAMLSGVLNSPRAIAVNIAIMRTFTELRKAATEETILNEKMKSIEKKLVEHDKAITLVVRVLNSMRESQRKPVSKIGFSPEK